MEFPSITLLKSEITNSISGLEKRTWRGGAAAYGTLANLTACNIDVLKVCVHNNSSASTKRGAIQLL